MHTCSIFAKNCFHLESDAIDKYNKYKTQMKVTETLQMYRYPRTVQLEILQMYRIDYLLQRHINSSVREATRECVSKWIGLWTTKYRFGTSRKFCHCIGRDHTTCSFLSCEVVIGPNHLWLVTSFKAEATDVASSAYTHCLNRLDGGRSGFSRSSPKRTSKSEISSNNVA